MLEQDYLMRILLQFAEAIRRSWSRAVEDRDPRDAANMLERAVGDATDIDGATLLSLSPESIASVMQVSGVDPRVSEYIARSLLLASGYLGEAGEHELAALRASRRAHWPSPTTSTCPIRPKSWRCCWTRPTRSLRRGRFHHGRAGLRHRARHPVGCDRSASRLRPISAVDNPHATDR